MGGVFSILPENFFSPLAGGNRCHYAALLVKYYRIFQDTSGGIERELVVREFTTYLQENLLSLAEEEADLDDAGSAEQSDAEEGILLEEWGGGAREAAYRFLRRLVSAGWLSEECLADYTRVINITAWAKPFFDALIRVDEGLKTEYESHVVNMHSSLCGETVKENGYFTVREARKEARALIDSLKVLSQNIKAYYDKLNERALSEGAAGILHEHYDVYAGDVLDKAYKRLKTSDNVSRYRQAIFRQISSLLKNEEWLKTSARQFQRTLDEEANTENHAQCREKIAAMLEEIREDLHSVDPLEDEIDRRNADYSRASTEIIKAYIEPDSTVAGKAAQVIKAIYSGDEELSGQFAHRIHRLLFLSPSSISLRRQREAADFTQKPSKTDMEAVELEEKKSLERMKKRLSIKKISEWLDEQGGSLRALFPEKLIKDEKSFVRFVYALLYGESRANFDYNIEENEKKPRTSAAGFSVPNAGFRKKRAQK